MIDLTPLDVRKKKDDFKRAVRGYDPMQVDAFLDVVADRLEQLVREHGSLSDKLEHLESSLASYQERERALNEALLAAQELREEARSQAERDAAVRLREAETHAEAILLDADQAIRHSQRRMEDLRARRRQFLKSLRGMMDRLEDYLELEETRLETEAEDLGDLLERLETDLEEGEGVPMGETSGSSAGPHPAGRVPEASSRTASGSAQEHPDERAHEDDPAEPPSSEPTSSAIPASPRIASAEDGGRGATKS
ncbi:MAG: DivIVA domain-containing protein [Gemmatimonadota bacterium]|nr:DivIVA domain-containing protein [Gemmatimonadota bacterium]